MAANDPLVYARSLARLQSARRAPVSPTIQLDLARSGLDDDQLDEAATILGAAPPQRYALDDIFDEWLSRTPQTELVGDLKQLQTNLRAQGYLPTTYEPTGVWDAVSRSAFGRWRRDGFEAQMGGDKPGAASLPKAIEWIGHTLPTNAIKGLVGTIKGTIEQAPETLERIGAAPIVGPIRLGVEAVKGLFGIDDDEDKSAWETLKPPGYDSMDEVMEDLGWLLTVGSGISGGVTGVKGVVGAARAVRAGQGALAKGAAVQTPKIGSARLIAAALRGNIAAGGGIGAAEGLLFGENMGDVFESAAFGAGISVIFGKTGGKHWADRWMNFVGKHGLAQQLTRPALKGAQSIYTGANMTQIGGRLFGGMFQEEPSTIAKAIEEAPDVGTFDIPVVGGDFIDWTVGSLLFPTQFLPFKMSGVAKAADRALGAAHLEDWIHVMGKEFVRNADGVIATNAKGQPIVKTLSRGKSREEFFKMGDSPAEVAVYDQFHRLQAGTNHRVAEEMRKLPPSAGPLASRRKAMQVKASLNHEILSQGGPQKSKLAKELVEDTYKNGEILRAHLTEIQGKGSGVWRWKGYNELSRDLQDLQFDWQAGRAELQADVQMFEGMTLSTFSRQEEYRMLIRRANRLKQEAGGRLMTSGAREKKLAEAAKLTEKAKEVRKAIGRTHPKRAKDKLPNLMAAREDTLTRQQLTGFAQDYETKAINYQTAFRAFRKEANPQTTRAIQDAEEDLFSFLDDLDNQGALEPSIVEAAKQPKFMQSVKKGLTDYADIAPSEVSGLPDEVAQKAQQFGYKVVATGEDVIKINDVPRLLEITGVADYTRRQAFFAAIRGMGLDPHVRKDETLFSLRSGHTSAEFQLVSDVNGLKLKGNRILRDLNKYLHDRNHPGTIKDENVSALGPFIRRQAPGRRGSVELFKVDIRELKVDDIKDALELERRLPEGVNPDEVALKLYRAAHRGAAFGGEAHILRHPIEAARDVARTLNVNGLPGFSDWMRTTDLTNTPRLGKMLRTAFPKGHYGHLPQALHRFNMAVRYTLSPTFDMGRYIEQNMLGAVIGDLPMIVKPHRYVSKRAWKSPFRDGEVTGEQAWDDAIRLWDEINGGKAFQITDDIERRMFQTGLLGFSPRHHEAAQAWVLYQRGWGRDKIRETVLKLGRYGLGRSAAEKSANFIFFPFSFQKKLITSLGDWTFSAPLRALMIHEGMRMFNEVGVSDSFGAAMEKYFPLFDELKQVNNLAFGISPGRFFLNGLTDNKSDEGKAAQIIASFLAPSGAATPLAQAAGKAADRTIHAFTPVVVTGEKLPDFADIVDSLAPLVRDVRDFAEVGIAQKEAFPRPIGTGAEPYHQLTSYLDGKKGAKAPYDALAQAFGYADADGLFQSPAGAPLKAQYDEEVFQLQEQYPKGWEMSRSFEEEASVKKHVLLQIANDSNPSKAESEIQALGEIEEAGRALADQLNVRIADVYPLVMQLIRERAKQNMTDRRFREMYATFFADDFGPLEAIAA